jgi:hypothetical protein
MLKIAKGGLITKIYFSQRPYFEEFQIVTTKIRTLHFYNCLFYFTRLFFTFLMPIIMILT